MSYRFGQNMIKPTFGQQKSWLGRKRGVMKKANDICELFGVKVALLIEREGVLYAYQSHDNFPVELPGLLLASNKMTPKNFITLADQESKQSCVRSQSPPAVDEVLVCSPVDDKIENGGHKAPKKNDYCVPKRGKRI
jgi:hypothetical protein